MRKLLEPHPVCSVCGGGGGSVKLHAKGMCGVCYTRKKSLEAGVPPNPTRDMSIAEKLAYKSVKRDSGCIEYVGTKDKDGYGVICYNGKTSRAHRIAYELAKGPIPSNLQVLHKCDNPCCINPEHLIVGSSRDNQKDKVNKNRQAKGASHGAAVLTAEDVEKIRADSRLLKFIAKDYGICVSQVGNIRRGESWKSLPR